jgi:hypothetical protein
MKAWSIGDPTILFVGFLNDIDTGVITATTAKGRAQITEQQNAARANEPKL